MPPAASPDGANPQVRPDDLDGLIESEQLPSGRDDLPEPLVAQSQRERILMAMAKACAAKGYGATTVADVVEIAGVSRATFYELFKDKNDCLEATMELSLADAMGRIVEVYSPEKPWAESVRDAATTFLDLLARRPHFARMALIEAPAIGGRAFELYASGKRVLQILLDSGRAGSLEEDGIPSSAGPGAIAAAESLVVGQILAGNTRRLRDLVPDLIYVLTIPYMGQEEALRLSREAETSPVEPTRALQ